MERVPLLVALDGPQRGNRYQILEGEGISIGRSEECDVVIDDPEVSRHHASVVLYNAGIWVRDAGSRNGVFINEKRVVRPKELRPGGELNVGGHLFTLELDEVAVDDPSVIRPMRIEVPESGSGPFLWISLIIVVIIIVLVLFFLLKE